MKKQFSIIPNLLTSGNLVCGFLAIIFAVTDALKLTSYNDFINPFILSAWLVLAAMIFDMLDGVVARMTKTDSQFGKELDSLADLTSFGIAPGVILYLSVLRHIGKVGILIAVIYAVFAALRLARFNTIVKPDLKNFTGLPTPAAAGVLVSYVLFAQWGEWYYVNQPHTKLLTTINWYAVNVSTFNVYFLPVLMTVVAVLMVSSVKFFSLKQYVNKEKAPFKVLVMVVVTALVILFKPQVMFFVLTLGYVVFSLCSAGYLSLRGVRKKAQK